MILVVVLLGLGVGVLVGLLGIGGGVVLVPAMVYLLGMDQHMAQGTSLLILLPPLGLGALVTYWKRGQVDLIAGILCALGMLLGGYLGSRIAMPLSSRNLKGFFGCFLLVAAILLWRKTIKDCGAVRPANAKQADVHQATEKVRSGLFQHLTKGILNGAGILGVAGVCGVAAGLFGVGGGVLLIPVLGLLFAFSQHRAQGTSLVALIPPTSLLALLSYEKAGYVSWRTGLLLIPGIFAGGILGGILAKRIEPRRMRQLFAGLIFMLGSWQAASAWWR